MGLKIRQFWLRKSSNNSRWNLTPDNPYDIIESCALLNVKGLGYENSITSKQVDSDYYATEKKSKNTSITGTLYFRNDKHIQNFMQWIGSLDNEIEFHYSPNGDVFYSDLISDSWYKKVIINKFEKAEKNIYGWYEVSVTFLTLSDVWYRNKTISTHNTSSVGVPHTYPYFYSFYYSGKNVLAIDINNQGREIGCLIKIKNKSDVTMSDPQWYLETSKVNIYGEKYTSIQYAKFNIIMGANYELQVDSNSTTQRAEVITSSKDVLNVVDAQEPDYQYINFIRLSNGKNKVIFMVDIDKVDIELSYQLQSEVAY